MDVTSQVKTLLGKLKCQMNDQARWSENVKKEFKPLSLKYEKLNQVNRNPIDYQSPAIQFAYVYKYVICHADFLYQLLQQVKSELLLLAETDSEVSITCLGVGPGSDILGFLKFLSEGNVQESSGKLAQAISRPMYRNGSRRENAGLSSASQNQFAKLLEALENWRKPQDSLCREEIVASAKAKSEFFKRNLKFLLCDSEKKWKNIWDELNIGDGIELSNHFINFTRRSEWHNEASIFGSDFFTMIFFVSEIYKYDVRSVFCEIFSRAKPGALFLYIDNAIDDLRNFYDNLTAEYKLERIYSDDNQNLQCSPNEWKNKHKLNGYLKLLNHQPKKKSRVDMRVYRKPDPDHAA